MSDYTDHYHDEIASVLSDGQSYSSDNVGDFSDEQTEKQSYMWFDQGDEVAFEIAGVLYDGTISNEEHDIYGNVSGYTVIPDDQDELGNEISVDLEMLLDMNMGSVADDEPVGEFGGRSSDLLDAFDDSDE